MWSMWKGTTIYVVRAEEYKMKNVKVEFGNDNLKKDLTPNPSFQIIISKFNFHIPSYPTLRIRHTILGF
jgi:hypothetical protein